MAGFFRNFPLINYKFGDEVTNTLYQNISAYIGLIDEIKDLVESYTTVFIEDGDRPDNLSYKLYGTIDFYWTFYFLNDDIRESGWPLSYQDLLTRRDIDYPNRIITTQAEIYNTFLEGDIIEGITSGTTGTVVKRFLDLGQIVVKTSDNFNVGELVQANEDISTRVVITGDVVQYNAVHHYEDTSGNWVDIDPFDPSTSGLIPVTYWERMQKRNDALKEIKTFKPEVVAQIQSEFQKTMIRGF